MQLFSKEGVIKAGFSIETKELRRFLKLLKTTWKTTWKEEKPYCEITIKSNNLEFVLAGIKQTIKCEAWGPARIVISFMHFDHLVNDRPILKTKVVVGDDFMSVNETTVCVQTWFFKNDSILRSIDLPVNFKITDILRLSEKYTKEEIEFNKLSIEYRKAHDKLYDDIQKINRILKPYNISNDKVQEFIYKLLFNAKVEQLEKKE